MLLGGNGEDKLFGEGGNDRLIGGSQDDRLDGGEGNDTLYGGGGGDRFDFAGNFGHDGIRDFEDGLDRINRVGLRGDNGGDPLGFNQLIVTQDGADTHIAIDLYRDGIADAGYGEIDLVGFDAGNLSAADFQF